MTVAVAARPILRQILIGIDDDISGRAWKLTGVLYFALRGGLATISDL